MKDEIWKDIKGYNGRYQISSIGRAKNAHKGHVLQQSYNTRKYLKVSLCANGKTSSKLIHRLVAEAFIPNPDNLKYIIHINKVKTDNRVENLERKATNKTGKQLSKIMVNALSKIEPARLDALFSGDQVKFDNLNKRLQEILNMQSEILNMQRELSTTPINGIGRRNYEHAKYYGTLIKMKNNNESVDIVRAWLSNAGSCNIDYFIDIFKCL